MFENLTDKLERSFKILKGEGRITEINVAESLKEIRRALKPGGHVLAFSASRTYHRMACAVEDAGFEIRDQIDWIYGSGMPHGLDAARLVDERLGVERRVTGTYTTTGVGYRSDRGFGVSATNGGEAPREWAITEATSDEAKRWDGWNTALKPAHEPIVLARKPLDGCLADNLMSGTQIEMVRIGQAIAGNI